MFPSSSMIKQSFDLVIHRETINVIQSTMNHWSYHIIGILRQSYLLPIVLSWFYSHRSTCHVVLPRDGGDDFFVKDYHMTPAKSPGEIPGTDVPEKLRYCIVICYQRNLKLNMLNIENETLDLGKRSDSWFNSEVAIGANVFFLQPRNWLHAQNPRFTFSMW